MTTLTLDMLLTDDGRRVSRKEITDEVTRFCQQERLSAGDTKVCVGNALTAYDNGNGVGFAINYGKQRARNILAKRS